MEGGSDKSQPPGPGELEAPHVQDALPADGGRWLNFLTCSWLQRNKAFLGFAMLLVVLLLVTLVLVVVFLISNAPSATKTPPSRNQSVTAMISTVGSRSELAEGPFWNADEQLLFYVDMRANLLRTYDPASGRSFQAEIKTDRSPVTLVVRVKGTRDRYVVGLKGALAVVRWDGRSPGPLIPKYFAHVVDPSGTSRLNDGKADPRNRLWVGSMGAQLSSNPNTFEKDKGSLFRVSRTGEVTTEVTKLQLSNGLDWNLEADKMYFADSLANKVYQFDYDNDSGSIYNQQVLFDLKAEGLVEAMNSLPDGLTMDTEGKIWLAVYGSQKVIRIDPETGKMLLEITIPEVLQPTSVAFGGKHLDTLFVTSARVDWSEKLEARYPKSGRLIAMTGLGVKGLPSRDVELDRMIWDV